MTKLDFFRNALVDSLETGGDIQLPPTSPACQLKIHMEAANTAAVTNFGNRPVNSNSATVKSSKSGSTWHFEFSLQHLRTVSNVQDLNLCFHGPNDTLCSIQSGCHGQQVFIEIGYSFLFINKKKIQMFEDGQSIKTRSRSVAANKTLIMLLKELVMHLQ